MGFTGETVRFGPDGSRKEEVSEILAIVYRALEEKDYNPTNRIVGYLLSGGSVCIPRYRDAQNLIRRHERDEIMKAIVKDYLSNHGVNL